MSWGQEILRALFLTFGITQTILNLNYLLKQNGIQLARRQHTELPKNTSDHKMRIKVICMLISGLLFFGVALTSYIMHKYLYTAMIVSASLFCIYGLAEALHYRFWKTIGFGCVTVVLLILAILI